MINVKREKGGCPGMIIHIGKKVKLINVYGEERPGVLTEVLSDSYDDVRLKNGKVEYWSKKTKRHVPVRAKHEDSIFFEIKTKLGFEYVTEKEIIND
jgi:hypothetical protein